MEDVMLNFMKIFYFYGLLFISLIFSHTTIAENTINIPILCYHNFNPTKPGSMNLTPQKLEMQIKWLKDNGYTIIPLKVAVEYLQGKRNSLPSKAIVISADDGWKSVYTYMLPIVKKYNIPVTLFIYPQAISQGKNTMTWDELKQLQKTGLFDIQSHTYDHPNFKHEKKRRSASEYEKYVKMQLVNSKKILEDKLGNTISFLAWPFGIYDSYLEQAAANAGYQMAFTIDARSANSGYKPMAQPRFMIIDQQSMKTFAAIVNGANAKPKVISAQKH
jgi:peptidoglycan/xylan/chitin deacetylase (PgdA/CDA1 family)